MNVPAPPLVTIEIQGVCITHAVTGDADAPPVLMLHGWGASVGLVWPLALRLAAHGYCVYAFDLPGFGASEPPPAAWSVHDYVKFVLAYMDFHRLERVCLFGHSFGGRLGLVLGAQYGDRIRKMVLADSAGVRPRAPLAAQVRLKTYKIIRSALHTVSLHRLAEYLRQKYNARYGSADFQAASGVMRETFVKVVNEDLLPFARRVKPPTLLLWGEHDADTPLAQGKLLEEAIADAGLVVLQGAGHYSYLERLAEVTRIIDHFFKQP